MANLGTFNRTKPVEDAQDFNTFTVEGVEIRVKHKFNELQMMHTMRKLQKVDQDDPGALDLAFKTFTLFIVDEDADLFVDTVVDAGYDMEDVNALLEQVVEAMTDRPTKPLPDSSVGQQTTGESSTPDSSLPASNGRPDLQLIRSMPTAQQVLAA